MYLCENSAPLDEVVNSLGACITESTLRVSPILKNISLKTSSEEALILCGNNKAFSHFSGTDGCHVNLHQLFSWEGGFGHVKGLTSRQY